MKNEALDNFKNEEHQIEDERKLCWCHEKHEILKSIPQLIENRRLKVLANQSDPSWTEHFAELKNEIECILSKICHLE